MPPVCPVAATRAGLAPLVAEHGLASKLLAKPSPAFNTLAKSILFQQLAMGAASAIYARFLAACGAGNHGDLTPQAVLATPPEALRGAGLSTKKVGGG